MENTPHPRLELHGMTVYIWKVYPGDQYGRMVVRIISFVVSLFSTLCRFQQLAFILAKVISRAAGTGDGLLTVERKEE